jgi:GT2 family glycosyltransferase
MNLKTNSSFSIALVNYKTHDVTSICLDLLSKAINSSGVTVWVVDNGSNDASLDFLKSQDWIRLIERSPPAGEAGFMAHGGALDMILERVDTKYLLLMHTDTFIYDPTIFDVLLEKCVHDEKVAAVGCLEPVWRSLPHLFLRYVSRGAKYYYRKYKLALGLKSRRAKFHYETHLKSFCTLWNVDIIRKHGMTFSMGNRTPSYEMQDQLTNLGYKLVSLSTDVMFKYLDHVDKATASAKDGVRINDRRLSKYKNVLGRAKNRQVDSS